MVTNVKQLKASHTSRKRAEKTVKWPTFKKSYLKIATEKFKNDPAMLELLKSVHQGRDFK